MTLTLLSLSRLPDLSSERRFSFFQKPSIICLPTLSLRPREPSAFLIPITYKFATY